MKWRERVFPLVVFLSYTALFSVVGIARINTYLVAGYDLGIFDQVVRAYAHFRAPIVTLKGDSYNIWGDHFHPIVALWAPLYWVWDNIRVLAIGHALVVASAVFPVWRFLRRRFVRTLWAKVFVVGVLAAWPIQGLINFDAHEIAFAVPLLAWIVDALDRRDDKVLLVCTALLLLVREDMGVLVAMTGVVRLVWYPSRRPRSRLDWAYGIGLVVVGLAVFVLVTRVIIPHFATAGYQYWDYGDIVAHPWKVLWLWCYPWVKTWTWLALLVPVGFMALFSPYALIALPIMAERMLASRHLLWVSDFHYNAPVWIIVCLAAVDGLQRLRARRLAFPPFGERGLSLLVVGTTVVGLALSLVPSMITVRATFPYERLITGRAFMLSPGAPDRKAVVAWLPADTCVAADDRVAGQLTHTNRITVPGVSAVRQDFYVLDFAQVTPATTPVMWTTLQAYEHARDQGFHEVFRSGTIVVLRSEDYTGPDHARCRPV